MWSAECWRAAIIHRLEEWSFSRSQHRWCLVAAKTKFLDSLLVHNVVFFFFILLKIVMCLFLMKWWNHKCKNYFPCVWEEICVSTGRCTDTPVPFSPETGCQIMRTWIYPIAFGTWISLFYPRDSFVWFVGGRTLNRIVGHLKFYFFKLLLVASKTLATFL